MCNEPVIRAKQLLNHLSDKQYGSALDLFAPLSGDICVSLLLKQASALPAVKPEIELKKLSCFGPVVSIKRGTSSLMLTVSDEAAGIRFDHFPSVLRREKYKKLKKFTQAKNCRVYSSHNSQSPDCFLPDCFLIEDTYLKMTSLLETGNIPHILNYVICDDHADIHDYMGSRYTGDFFDARNLYIFSSRKINAHELAHAATRNIPGWPPLFLREGFAFWVQAKAEGKFISRPDDMSYKRLLNYGHAFNYKEMHGTDYEAAVYFIESIIKDAGLEVFKKIYTIMTFYGFEESPVTLINKVKNGEI